MSSLDLVRNYFDREAVRFDAIYREEKPALQRLVDFGFRRVVRERFRLITMLAPRDGAWTALDVGCGSGRYAVAFARAGAERVVGIDVSPAMLVLARGEARRAGVDERCDFRLASFLDFGDSRGFDVAVATGYFDYLEDPSAHLRKMCAMCRGMLFVSFPKRWEIRAPLRKLRFMLARGYVRFYGRNEVMSLCRQAGLDPDRDVSLVDLGRDWVAIARMPRRSDAERGPGR